MVTPNFPNAINQNGDPKLNYYVFILGLFVIAGFVGVLWGWFIIAKARKTLRWPMVEGVIEQSALTSEADDLLPHILFSYTVATYTYQRTLEFPNGTNPSPELASSYAKKYPVGAKVSVYYNPDQPDQATLEPGLARGDWMIPVLGIAAMALGIFALFFSNY
ncbi:MAG: Protein of unknown function (DUF3592) [Candidatus Nitrotoga sp. SPKER]|nr:MAG: Protein of unknown function (DUF3592) [Candidatus Nitrotoga sp. SPKER]